MGALDQTYKPDSVPLGAISPAVVIISLELKLPRASCDLPENIGWATDSLVASILANHDRPPIWSCSGRRLPCRSCRHERGGLLLHLFTLTWSLWTIGGLFSVAPVSDRSAWVLPSTLPLESGLSSRCMSGRAPGLVQCADSSIISVLGSFKHALPPWTISLHSYLSSA